jgi:hypothetical protein
MKAAGVACGTTVTGSVVFGATATPGVYTISDLLECSVQVATEITLRLVQAQSDLVLATCRVEQISMEILTLYYYFCRRSNNYFELA